MLALGCVSVLAACDGGGTSNPPDHNPPGPQTTENKTVRFNYPQTAKVDVVDDYHGTKVADPYRWLEDLDSKETAAWIEEQNKVTFGYLNTLPQRGPIKTLLTKLWDYERWGVPFEEGGRYFVSRNDGLQNQSVLYTMKSLEDEPRVLLDPNTLSADGTVALGGMAISRDGKRMAYSLSSAGSDWQEWRVRDIESGKDLPDLVKWAKFSGASWTKDGKGFYYSRYDEPKEGEALQAANFNHKLYYHAVGTSQADDKLVYERPDHPDWNLGGSVTHDGKFLIIEASQGTDPKSRVYVQDLKSAKAPIVPLREAFDARYDFVGNDGDKLYFLTDKNAPRNRLVAIDRKNPDEKAWKELIPEGADTLESVQYVGGRFVARYLHDAASRVTLHDKKTGAVIGSVDLPGLGTVSGFSGDPDRSEAFYSVTGFTNPGTIYRYDVSKGESKVFRQAKVTFDPAKYETRQVFYASKDGTQVPMFIVHRKGLELDGNNPVYLYGYGGFNISLTPGYSPAVMGWLEMGGVYAVANLRGGGEYGEAWHAAGTKLEKQRVFEDFIAAGEYLVANKYTRPQKLAIGGRSNGGLLAGAALTQRPDLFGVVLAGVGVLDMLRFHKFTIGWAWTSDYGSSDDPEQFKALLAYSPLHSVKPGTKYPATMVYTADHDDRVVPSHSFKFASALQAAQAGDAPTLIRVDVRAGHGAGKPTGKQIEEWADLWAFTAENLGMDLQAISATAK